MKKTILTLIFLAFFSPIFCIQTIEKAGNILQIALPVVAYTATLVLNDKTGQYEFYESFALSLGATYLLKYTVDKERPNGRGHNSFPSGHTSAAFQAASFIQMRYGWEYGVPSYVVASFVGYSRVQSKEHYIEDVVAGAAIGILCNLIFTKKYSENDLEISPIVSGKSFGLMVSFNF